MARGGKNEVKVYTLDTSSIIEFPECIREVASGGNTVIIPKIVLGELDKRCKSRDESDSFHARSARNILLELVSQNLIYLSFDDALANDDKKLSNGGKIAFEGEYPFDIDWNKDTIADDHIINCFEMINLKAEEKGLEAVLISEDGIMNLKAHSKGLPHQTLKLSKSLLTRSEDLYSGVEQFFVNKEVFDLYFNSEEKLNRFLSIDDLKKFVNKEVKLIWNQGVILIDKNANDRKILLRYNSEKKILESLKHAFIYYKQYTDELRNYKPKPICRMIPGDPLQIFYSEFLLDKSITFLVCNGGAGTGKTKLFCAAALHLNFELDDLTKNFAKTIEIREYLKDNYPEGILLLRPEVRHGTYDHGALPGDLERKLRSFFEVYDEAFTELCGNNKVYYKIKDSGLIKKFCSSYLQGQSFSNKLVGVDEAQNANASFAYMLQSRLDSGSKFVVEGSIEQIQPEARVNIHNNSLTLLTEVCVRQRPTKDFAAITLVKNYRQPGASKAEDLKKYL